MNFYEKIIALCESKGITKTTAEKELGLSQNSINKWKTSTPSMPKLQKIAQYFNVSVNFLLGLDYSEPSNVYDVDSIASFEEIGSIRAGYGSLAIEDKTGKTVDIPVSMLNGRPQSDYFVLRVKGNSMYPKLIEGDNILCLRCDSVDSGDYAVILYNGDEATVKQVRYVFGEDWLELIPTNPEYAPKKIEGADLLQCKVIGKVIKLIRDF